MSDSQADKPKEEPPTEETPQLEDWQIQRDQHKKSADAAFRVGGFKTAIDQYTKAISVDPEFVVLYSNRSAAFLANGESSKALRDARKCVELDASFVKGHSRLGAALLALKRFEQARASYEFVLGKDPANKAALKGVDVCKKEITKRMTMEEQKRQQEEQARKEAMEKQKAEEEAEQAGDDDDDDLLAGFFDEVEEVVAKKKEVAAASSNAIRNDRVALGTTQEQIDRLLQPRYEWRNLNPYFVLQLKAATSTDDDISRRYKALSLLLHPDKNRSKLATEEERDRAQLAYDQVQKAKIILQDADRKKHIQSLVEEGMKIGESRWNREHGGKSDKESLESIQEKEVMRIFAQIEHKRREVEERERKFEQREQQQQDDQEEKERRERKFDKQWRDKDRVDKRVGNWRDFDVKKKRKL